MRVSQKDATSSLIQTRSQILVFQSSFRNHESKTMHLLTLITLSATLSGLSLAHPGHDVAREVQEREAALAGLPRDLSHCAEKMKARGITAESAARRAKTAREARKARGLDTSESSELTVHRHCLNSCATEAPFLTARTAISVENTNHESNHSYTAATSEALLFEGMSTCVLSPDVTEGPYCKLPRNLPLYYYRRCSRCRWRIYSL